MKKILSIALITLIFISLIPLTITALTRETQDITKNNVYNNNGLYEHYYIYRTNTTKNGNINLTYQSNTTLIDIELNNIKRIDINMPSLHENHSNEVFTNPLTLTEMTDFFITNQAFQVTFKGDLKEINLLDLDIQPEHLRINGQKVPYSYQDGDLHINLTNIQLKDNNRLYVDFIEDSPLQIAINNSTEILMAIGYFGIITLILGMIIMFMVNIRKGIK